MGIDFALRDIGSQLYPDNKLPDYDFMSPTFHIDAYTIGEQLVAAGLQGVSVIRAYHISTMKVRVNFVGVADIGYIPQVIYDKIPTITYQGIRIIHPHFQMIDQYRALSLPFENPPLESFMNRWKKDMKRNDLIIEHFPFKQPKISEVVKTHNISTNILTNNCLGGVAALAYWLSFATTIGYKNTTKLNFNVTNNVAITIPLLPLTIITDDYITLLADNHFSGDKKYYNAILDKIPRRIIVGDYEIIDNKGQLLSASKSNNIYISNLQGVMCSLLTTGILYDNKIAMYYYTVARNLLEWACGKYIEKPDDTIKLLLPTVETYGKYNWAESYELQREDAAARLQGKQPCCDTPKNAYPEVNKKINDELYSFQPDKSNLYQFDGLETKPFTPRKLI
jgi:hypothetical protein